MACILTLQVKVDSYLLINGGVAASRGHPHLLIEAIADGVRQVDTGVTVASQDRPAQQKRKATIIFSSKEAENTSPLLNMKCVTYKHEKLNNIAPGLLERDKKASHTPEALEAELKCVGSSFVLPSIHHRSDLFRVLDDHRHLAVALPQHASVVDISRT